MSTTAEVTAPPRSLVRPTARGLLAILASVVLLVGADMTGLSQGRIIAAAMISALLLSFGAILLAGVGLSLERRVAADAVPVEGGVDVVLILAPHSLLGRLPLGRAVVRSYLPGALGGSGDLAFAARMPHTLPVLRRGHHALGPCAVLVRDVLGMFHRRTVLDLPGQVTGLPRVESSAAGLGGPLGAMLAGPQVAASMGQGEPGPIARPYVPGDDIRRIHWTSSARTGRLMSREEEPPAARSATILLDTRPGPGEASPELERAQDRVIDHAATALTALRGLGFDVTVLDADGDRILAAERSRPSLGPRAPADASVAHASLIALAEVGFGDPMGREPAGHGADGSTALVLALGTSRAEPFAGLDLDRFAGRAPRRIGITIRPEESAEPGLPAEGEGEPRSSWQLLDGGPSETLEEILRGHAAAPIGGRA